MRGAKDAEKERAATEMGKAAYAAAAAAQTAAMKAAEEHHAKLCRPELELELIQSQMAQKPVLRGEVGARALRVRSVPREEVRAGAGARRAGLRLLLPSILEEKNGAISYHHAGRGAFGFASAV